MVTGGSSGIGRSVALLCAELGARVAVTDVDRGGAERAAGEALERGAPQAVGLHCDVTAEDQVEAVVAAVQEELGVPYGLFANAGIDIGGFAHEMPYSAWDRVLRTNLDGVFLACKHTLRAMVAAGRGGSVVCTSSPGAFVAFAAGEAGAYSASKGGISSLVRSLAVDYAPHGIRVNAVVPGATETPLMWSNVPEDQIDRMRKQVHTEVPLGRLADPVEVARAVVWLLSDAASYVTGSHLVCDGGILAKGSISF